MLRLTNVTECSLSGVIVQEAPNIQVGGEGYAPGQQVLHFLASHQMSLKHSLNSFDLYSIEIMWAFNKICG